MSIGLNVKTEVYGLDKLKKQIEFISKMATLKTNKNFQQYLQKKFLETVNKISIRDLPEGELKGEYISHNQIRELDDGFVIYNDTFIETDTDGYGGKFSIALAFEYGTGLVGQENPKVGAWQYNVNQHEKGWIYFKDGTFHFTRGMRGYEIYRFSRDEIENNLKTWVLNYTNGKEV